MELFGIQIGNFAGSLSIVSQLFNIFFFAVIAGGLTWLVTFFQGFKIIVKIEEELADGTVITFTKAKQYKNKDKIVKWKLLNNLFGSVNPPSNDFLRLTKKGKLFAECKKSLTGNYIWIKRANIEGGEDEFTSEEKLAAVVELRRANDFRKKDGLSRLYEALPVMMAIMILVITFAFWGDVTNAATQANTAQSAANIESSKQLAQASNRLAAAMEAWNANHGVVVTNESYYTIAPPGGINIPN